MDPSEVEAKKSLLIKIAKRNFKLKHQTNNGGNLSVKLSSIPAIIIKPSGIGFNELKPSKDLDFHLGLYNARLDINAIVHCHSPWATACASSGIELPCLTVQTKEKLGKIPLIPLSENGGSQTSKEITPIMSDESINAAMLVNHGTVGLGKTLISAQYIVELIEETAHIFCINSSLK